MDFKESSVKDLSVPKNNALILPLKVSIFLFGILTSSVFIFFLEGWAIVPFQILMGLSMAYGVEVQHQVLHTRRRFSKGFSPMGFLLGLPMLVSFTCYKDAHLHHHRAVGTDSDEEFFDYGSKNLASLRSLTVMLFMLPHYRVFARRVLLAVIGGDLGLHSRGRQSVARAEYILIASAVFVAVFASFYWAGTMFLTAWLIPLILFAGPIHTLVEIPEHYRCETSNPEALRNTRTVVSNSFMYRFTNGNNFHVEHHYCSSWPMDKLHILHEKIRDRIVYKSVGYREFYLMFVRDVIDAALARIRETEENSRATT